VSDVSIHSVSITGNYPFGTHVINRICELLNTETLGLIASFSLAFSSDGRHLTYAIGVQLVGARVQAQRIDPGLLSGTFEGEVGLDQPLTAEEAKVHIREVTGSSPVLPTIIKPPLRRWGLYYGLNFTIPTVYTANACDGSTERGRLCV
jgi:hypothetical protein